MKRLITICAVIGLMLAVTGTAGADVVWTITIQHNGGAGRKLHAVHRVPVRRRDLLWLGSRGF